MSKKNESAPITVQANVEKPRSIPQTHICDHHALRLKAASAVHTHSG